jgi:hypothetical protein
MIFTTIQKKTLYDIGILFAILIFTFLSVDSVFAAGSQTPPPPLAFEPLTGIPGLDKLNKDTTIPEYINQVYLLIIVVGALLGVMRLAWAGVKYSLSDVVTEKSEAKHDMTGVLMGLAILLIPFVVLKEINPDLVNLNVLEEARNFKIKVENAPSANSVANGTGNNPVTGADGQTTQKAFNDKLPCHPDPTDEAACRAYCSNILKGQIGDSGLIDRKRHYYCNFYNADKDPSLNPANKTYIRK